MATSRVLPAASNPYSGGAVILDSSPYVQFALNKQAREEANRNAFIKGFQDISSNINAAGLDNNDAQDLYAKKAAWQNYVMSHQKEYQNPSLDNGRVYAEANKLYNDAAQHIQAAKLKMANIAEAKKILDDPNKADLLNETFHQKLENARKPISTMGKQGGYEPIDYSTIYNPKPFDNAKYLKELEPHIKYSPREGKTTKDADFNTKTEIYEVPQYDKLDLYRVAEEKYAQTPSYQREIKRLSNDPEIYKKYNQIFKDNFGKDLDIKHPEEMAVAHTLSLMPQERLKEIKTGFDRTGYFDYTNSITNKQKKENIQLNKNGQGQQQQEGNLFDTIGGSNPISIGKDKSMNNGIITFNKDNSPYNGEVFISKEFIPSNVYSALKSSGADNDVLLGNKGFMATVKNGRIEGLKDKFLGYIDRQSMANAQLKYDTEPIKGKKMGFGKESVSSPNTPKKASGVTWKK